MSSTVIADRKYLKKFVEKTITELMDPVENPEIHAGVDPMALVSSGARQLSQEAKRRFYDQIKGASQKARWILTKPSLFKVAPVPAKNRTTAPMVFVPSDDAMKLFASLKNKVIKFTDEKSSVENIRKGLIEFINLVGSDDMLRGSDSAPRGVHGDTLDERWTPPPARTGAQDKIGLRRAVNFYKFLKDVKYRDRENEVTDMRLEITSLFKLKGRTNEEAIDEGFFTEAFDDLNNIGTCPDCPALNYIAWKTLEDDEFRSAFTWGALFPITLAASFLAAGPLAAIVGTNIFVMMLVEVFLFDIGLEILFGVGEGGIPRVSVTSKEVTEPFEAFLEEISKPDIIWDSRKEELISEYENKIIGPIDQLVRKYIADWVSLIEETGKNDKVKAQLAKIGASGGAHKTKNLRSLNKDRFIRHAKNSLHKYKKFFEQTGDKSEKEITLPLRTSMGIHIKQFGKHLKSVGSAMGPQPGEGAAFLAREGANVDTGSGEFGVNKQIAALIGIRYAHDVGSAMAEFSSIYDSWKKGDADDGRPKTAGLISMWDRNQKLFSNIKRELATSSGNAAQYQAQFKDPAPGIDGFMREGWCVYDGFPLQFFGYPHGILNVGIGMFEEGVAFVASNVTTNEDGDIRANFARMIRHGDIGESPDGEYIYPEHLPGAIDKIKTAVGTKSGTMKALEEALIAKKESGRIGEDFYKKRIEFVKSYVDLHDKLAILLGLLKKRIHKDECGGDLSDRISNDFGAIRAWHNHLKER